MSRLHIVTCLFNLYAEYIVQNAGLVEAQARIKIARINIHNLSYADDTTLMAESKRELKSLLMKMKEESEKAGLNTLFKRLRSWHLVPSVQFSSVAQSCLALCDPMDSSIPGLPVIHQLPELTQTHVI